MLYIMLKYYFLQLTLKVPSTCLFVLTQSDGDNNFQILPMLLKEYPVFYYNIIIILITYLISFQIF